MKHLTIIFFLSVSTAIFAQKVTEKNLGDFNQLKVYDLIKVELIKANENKLTISGNNAENVIVNNKNGTLKIKMNISKAYDGKDTKVSLYYKNLDVIDANEGAKIYSKDEIKQFEIDLRAQEGGIINVSVNVNFVNAKAVTGGVIDASGTTKKESITLLTGGVFNGQSLKSENADVSINAAGEATIHASNVVDVSIRAGGNVYIYGNPETVNENKLFGGKIKRME